MIDSIQIGNNNYVIQDNSQDYSYYVTNWFSAESTSYALVKQILEDGYAKLPQGSSKQDLSDVLYDRTIVISSYNLKNASITKMEGPFVQDGGVYRFDSYSYTGNNNNTVMFTQCGPTIWLLDDEEASMFGGDVNIDSAKLIFTFDNDFNVTKSEYKGGYKTLNSKASEQIAWFSFSYTDSVGTTKTMTVEDLENKLIYGYNQPVIKVRVDSSIEGTYMTPNWQDYVDIRMSSNTIAATTKKQIPQAAWYVAIAAVKVPESF